MYQYVSVWPFRVTEFKISSMNNRGGLDLAVLFTPSTPNRQNRNQVSWNTCAGVLHLPRCCRQNSHVTCSKIRWRSIAYTILSYFCLSRWVLIIIHIEKNMVINKRDSKHIYFVILFASSWQSDKGYFYTIQTVLNCLIYSGILQSAKFSLF